MISTSDFSKEINEKGWVKFEQVLTKDTIAEINNAISPAYENCRRIQIENGVASNTDGTVHHVLCQGSAFLEFIKQLYLDEYIFSFFSSPYILNSFGAIINIKNKLSYVGNIHRDIRTFYNVPMMINMLVMLDDFTLENGATYFLTRSNKTVEEPGKDFFYT